MVCKICGCPKISNLGIKDNEIVYKCEYCTFVFIDNNELNDNLVGGYGELERNYLKLSKGRFRRLKSPKKILDFGCGHGMLVDYCRKKGADTYGIDLNTELQLDNLTEEHIFDAITLIEVIEHLYNPLEVLAKLRNHLSEYGIIYIESSFTDTEKLYGNTDISTKSEDLLNWWYLAPKVGHISFFNQKSMEIMVNRLGLRLLEPREPLAKLSFMVRQAHHERKNSMITTRPPFTLSMSKGKFRLLQEPPRYNANVFRVCKMDYPIPIVSKLYSIKSFLSRLRPSTKRGGG